MDQNSTPSAKVSDEAVEAAYAAQYGLSFSKEKIRHILTAALPHLTACVGEGWRTIESQPDFDERPCHQIIKVEGTRLHSDLYWKRQFVGEAFIRKSDGPDAICGYRASDIERLCDDGDIDIETVQVTFWKPFPAAPTPEASRG